MAYVKAPIPSEVYHLTKKANLESILDDGAIRRFDDTECWFCESLAKMKAYMEQTVLCEGKAYFETLAEPTFRVIEAADPAVRQNVLHLVPPRQVVDLRRDRCFYIHDFCPPFYFS